MRYLVKARVRSGVAVLAKAIAGRAAIVVAAIVGRGRHRAFRIVFPYAGHAGIADVGCSAAQELISGRGSNSAAARGEPNLMGNLLLT